MKKNTTPLAENTAEPSAHLELARYGITPKDMLAVEQMKDWPYRSESIPKSMAKILARQINENLKCDGGDDMNRVSANQFLTGCQHEQAVRAVAELVIQGASSDVIQQALTNLLDAFVKINRLTQPGCFSG